MEQGLVLHEIPCTAAFNQTSDPCRRLDAEAMLAARLARNDDAADDELSHGRDLSASAVRGGVAVAGVPHARQRTQAARRSVD